MTVGTGARPWETIGEETSAGGKRQANNQVGVALDHDVEIHLDGGRGASFGDQGWAEHDDAPSDLRVPEWQVPQEDAPILPDREFDPPDLPPGADPAVRLSITLEPDGTLSSYVDLPSSDDPVIERRLDKQYAAMTRLADKLIAVHPRALTCTTPLEALRAMQAVTKRQLWESEGQGSRDRHVVIDTPFGLAPLWLFSEGHSGTIYRDLLFVITRLGQEGRRQAVDADFHAIRPVPVNPSPGSILRRNKKALNLALANPEVVAFHRGWWPNTHPENLLDDLGLVTRAERSGPLAVLVLLGALDWARDEVER